jgi:hypothetical protein
VFEIRVTSSFDLKLFCASKGSNLVVTRYYYRLVESMCSVGVELSSVKGRLLLSTSNCSAE